MVDCTFATITPPAILANTAGFDYVDFVMPNSVYELTQQFQTDTPECPIT